MLFAGLAIEDVGVCGVVEAVTADEEDAADETTDLVVVFVAPSGADVEVVTLLSGAVLDVEGVVEVVAALVVDEVQPTTAIRHVATIEIFWNMLQGTRKRDLPSVECRLRTWLLFGHDKSPS